MTEILSEDEIEKLLHPPREKVFPRDKEIMSVEEAIEAFQRSDYIAGWKYNEKDEETFYARLGVFLEETIDYYAFLSYPYSSRKPIDYEYAFTMLVSKKYDSIEDGRNLSLYELREIEKKHGVFNLEPKEDTVKSIEQAKTILENSFFVKGIKARKRDKTVYFYQIGDFYAEYPSSFSFFGYPYTSLTPVDKNKAYLLLVDKWRGKVRLDFERLTEKEVRDSGKRELTLREKIGLTDWIEPDSDNPFIYGIDDYSMFKD